MIRLVGCPHETIGIAVSKRAREQKCQKRMSYTRAAKDAVIKRQRSLIVLCSSNQIVECFVSDHLAERFRSVSKRFI